MTQKEALAIAIESVTDNDASAVLQTMYDTVASRKPRLSASDIAKRNANENIKSDIITAIAKAGRSLTIADLNSEMGTSYSPSKLSALLTQMKDHGTVTVTHIKRIAYYDLTPVTAVAP